MKALAAIALGCALLAACGSTTSRRYTASQVKAAFAAAGMHLHPTRFERPPPVLGVTHLAVGEAQRIQLNVIQLPAGGPPNRHYQGTHSRPAGNGEIETQYWNVFVWCPRRDRPAVTAALHRLT